MQSGLEDINLHMLLSTRRYLVLTVALGALGVLILLLAALPQGQKAYELYQTLNAEKPKLTNLQQKLEDLNAIVHTPEYAQIETVQRALPSHKPLLELLTSFNAVSTATQVSIDQFQLSPGLIATDSAELAASTRASGPYNMLDLKLQISGTFEQIQEFMVQSESFSPFTTITSFTLDSNSADDPTERIIRAELTSDTFYFTQPIRVTIESRLPSISQPERTVLAKLSEFGFSELPEQFEVTGGGLEDLFGVESLFGTTPVIIN